MKNEVKETVNVNLSVEDEEELSEEKIMELFDSPITAPEKPHIDIDWKLQNEGLKETYSQVLFDMEGMLRYLETGTYRLREKLLNMAATGLFMEAVKPCDDPYRDKGIYSYEKELMGIEVTGDGHRVLIRIPALLPHRRSKPEMLMAMPLQRAAQEYAETEEGETFSKETEDGVLLVICHSYTASYMVRDNDNVEIKGVIDALVSSGLLHSDRGDFLDILSTADVSEEGNGCKLILIPKKDIKVLFKGIKA